MITLRKLAAYPIWHVESDDRWELAMTFLRIEEFYECPNPEFQGKVFSLETYMDWYVREYSKDKKPYGAFTYPSDWSAFNVPGSAVLAVYTTFTNHSEKERWLFGELMKQGALMEKQLYLIGNMRGADAFFEHEYRHALFALNPEYRAEVTAVVDRYAIPELRAWILTCYAQSVLTDEIQAYALTGWPRKCRPTLEMCVLKKELKVVEKRHVLAK
jgi:hypothetical protein